MNIDTLLEELISISQEVSPQKIHLEIPLRLEPKARPRRTTKGRKTWWYTPTSSNEEEIGIYATKLMRENGWHKLAGKVRLSATIYLRNQIKEDLSNLIKALEDSLEGICYYNDVQIREYGNIKVVNQAKKNMIIVDLEEIGRFKRKGEK